MTNAEILIAAGWIRVSRSTSECGDAIVSRKNLIGLACGKRGVWTREGIDFSVCLQHALLRTGGKATAGFIERP